MEIPEAVRDDLESRANVVGTSRGPKRVGGQPTDTECIVVLVSRKLPEAQLADADRIPSTVEIDGKSVPTDVQEVGEVRTLAAATRPADRPDRKRRWRPAPAGVSLGHPDGTAGTLGSPVLETDDGRSVVLTNAHVAAPIGDASQGDDVLQPGPADGGEPADALGRLSDFSDIARSETNTTDSALIEVDTGDLRGDILGIGDLAGFREPSMEATYTKSGRTTGVTTGDLRGRDTRIRVQGYYEEPTVFEGVDVFGPMSAAGDSGSLIGFIDGEFHATNLLFAGSDRATFGIPIAAVEAEHGPLTVGSEPSAAQTASTDSSDGSAVGRLWRRLRGR